jgi:hypothetical protein
VSANGGGSASAGLWGATVGAVAGYTAAVLAPFMPDLYYYPQIDAWRLTPVQGETPIRWYGYVLYSIAGGLLGALVGRLTGRRLPPTMIWWFGVVCLLALSWHEREWFGG